MNFYDALNQKRNRILDIAAQHGARNVRIFGSMARGDAGPSSDIDFLVDMDADRSLFDMVDLISDLENLLGRKVDVVTENSLYWLLRRRILKEAKPL